MNSFNCEKCGQKIRLPKAYAGKKGRCPKCKAVITIPEINDEISLKSPDSHTASPQYDQQPPEPELRLKRVSSSQTQYEGLSADGLIVTNETILRPEIKEKPPVRKLPAIVDIFLYPTSISGLINIGIFCISSLLFGIFSVFFRFTYFTRLPFLFIGAAVLAYMIYYIIECIRDSALGGIRAPDNLSSMPDFYEAVSQLWDIFIMMIILWLPLSGYNSYRVLTQPEHSLSPYNPFADTIFLSLLGYGVFFSPIAMLALAVFKSSAAYNPLIWITSIISTFFQYCGLVLLFSLLAFLVSRIAASLQGNQLNAAMFIAIFLYLAMIAAHLLGRFYYLNEKKLNWEV
ncbi:MAG: hypothetical protein JW787_11455 [Sedimentisphaerales bacterium]|nr:hypothetical protein [Sedimentisphaerales bacterium]